MRVAPAAPMPTCGATCSVPVLSVLTVASSGLLVPTLTRGSGLSEGTSLDRGLSSPAMPCEDAPPGGSSRNTS